MELMDSLISYIQFCEDCLSVPLRKCRLSVGRIKLLLFSKSNLGRLLRWDSLILRPLCAPDALHTGRRGRGRLARTVSLGQTTRRLDREVGAEGRSRRSIRGFPPESSAAQPLVTFIRFAMRTKSAAANAGRLCQR